MSKPASPLSMVKTELEDDGWLTSVSLEDIDGIDGVVFEMLKDLVVERLSRMTHLFNTVWRLGQYQRSGRPG